LSARTVDLDGIELVIFDKDGTLIDFHAMWGGWAEALVVDLERSTGRDLRERLFAMLGYDPVAGRAHAGGGLVAAPMARLRDLTLAAVLAAGVRDAEARAAVADAWHAPDPVDLVRPLTDLPRLMTALQATGRRCAIVTNDDRAPTVRTLAALGLTGLVDSLVCADDGLPAKPAPDAALHICARLGIAPARAAVVGDSSADIAMGRAAGVGLVIGVRTGVGAEVALTGADHLIDSVGELGLAVR
jgi:phosphoglycolate phosphatase